MYAEATIRATAVSPAVEDAARWVQWAQASVMEEAKSRYNLDQFWKAKASAYPNEGADGRAQLEKLDVLAHATWSALEQKKSVTASPDILPGLLSALIGTTPNRPGADQAAKQAMIAAQGAQAASRRLGGWGGQIGAVSLAGARITPQEGAKAWKMPSTDFLGVPLWAWLVGGGVIGLALVVRK